jgi:hypothetical protein
MVADLSLCWATPRRMLLSVADWRSGPAECRVAREFLAAMSVQRWILGVLSGEARSS